MDSSNNATSINISEAELKNLKLLLEKEGEKRLKQLSASDIVQDSNNMLEALTKIMKDGENEFVKKTGRRMTYSEIREMYG
jgi:hypothetical protein